MDADKARAKSFHTGVVFVAIGLVDLALAAELGLQRLHRDAVGGLRTIPTALANEIVDENALGRIGIEPALAAPPFSRGACLVIDQNREPLDLAQFALNCIQVAAV